MYDKSVRRMNFVSITLGILANALMMVGLYLGFDRSKCWAHLPPGLTDVQIAALMPDTSKKECYSETTTTFMLKCAMSAICIIHCLLIANYYRFQLRAERTSRWFIQDSVAWRIYVGVWLLIECLIILYHPFPVGSSNNTIYDDKLGVFMLFRAYLLIRGIRDTSSVYRARSSLLNDPIIKQSGAVEFNWYLSVKFVFLKNTWTFVLSSVISGWILFAYFIWVFEREQNYLFTLEKSLWMVGITFSTVGYGDISPVSGIGKIVTGFAAVAGILFTALLVFAVMDSLTLTPQDSRVKNLWIKQTTSELHRDIAAQYIQVSWRHFKKMRTLHIHSPETKLELKEWNSQNIFLKAQLRNCRREMLMATAADDLLIDRLVRKLEGLSVAVANRLAHRLGVRPHDRDKTELTTLPELVGRIDKSLEVERKSVDTADAILALLLRDDSSEGTMTEASAPATPRGFFDSFFG
eukprot:TRINITY_DN1480_c0_g1_i18.p1 TRINITY_DN1480_c0_g1~~TRINITY_DN1480_c0_g1_i18.p1  ORF type:complete len:465 (-),score=42.19 TRINITY_DN1480_c0_g1_i18:1059-2453(-)